MSVGIHIGVTSASSLPIATVFTEVATILFCDITINHTAQCCNQLLGVSVSASHNICTKIRRTKTYIRPTYDRLKVDITGGHRASRTTQLLNSMRQICLLE